MDSSECPRCGQTVSNQSNFCSRCGLLLTSSRDKGPPNREPAHQYDAANDLENPRPEWIREKDPNITLILALIPGLFGLMGIGHLYIGKIARGILFLLIGLIIGPIFAGGIYLLIMEGVMPDPIDLLIAGGFLILIIAIVLIGSTIDAYEQAKTYNHVLRTRGSPPW